MNVMGKQRQERRNENSMRAFAVAAALGTVVIGAAVPTRADDAKSGSSTPSPSASASASGNVGIPLPSWAGGTGSSNATAKTDTAAPKKPSKTEAKPAETNPPETKSAEAPQTGRSFYPSLFDATRYSYGSFPIAPLMPGGDIVMNKDAGTGVNVAIDNRAVRMFEMNLSQVTGLVRYPHQATYANLQLGIGTLRTRSDASFANGQVAASWRAGKSGFFISPDGANFIGQLALHHMWITGRSAIDVGASVGAGYSRYNVSVPVKLADAPADERTVGDGAFYTPVGLELAFPHLQGKRSPVRLEGIGASLIPGSGVVDVHAAVSGNFSDSARVLAIPRVNDNFGAVTYSAELRADCEVSKRFLLMPGLIGGYTHYADKDGTYLVGGYFEMGAGGSVLNNSGLGLLSMRVGGIGETGGDGAISPMMFVAVKMSTLNGPIF